jgi:hypothetical protein
VTPSGQRERRRSARSVFLAVALALAPHIARGQLGCSGATCTVEITMPVTDVVRLTLSQTSIALGTPTGSDYVSGYRDISGAAATVTVKANRAFRVQIVGSTSNFTYSGAFANPNKPASDLLWATSQAGLASTTNTMGASATLMNQGASASATQLLFLRTLWRFSTDVPGTYSLIVSVTLSAP